MTIQQTNDDGPIGPSVEMVPEGDNRKRLVCADCGYIEYDNPRIIVGAICEWEGKVLLCKRGIEPRKGYWTMPAGFMEHKETAPEGAVREVLEEALAQVEPIDLLGVYNIPHIGQVYLIYRARMLEATHGVGEESAEVALFDWDDIPWDELAFPSVGWALREYQALRDKTEFSARNETFRWPNK